MTINVINWTESDGRNPIVLFDNLLKDSTPSVAAAEDALTTSTYDAWNFTLPQTITFDMGSDKEFSAFALVGSDISGEVELSISTDDITYTPINTSLIAVEKGDCILFVFNKREARYFRSVFTGSGAASVRSFWLSQPLEFPGGIGYNYTPVWMAQEKELLVSKTMNGQFVGNRVLSKGAMTDIPMIAEERTFIEEDMQPFMKHYNDGQPFVFAAGPTEFTKDVSYVWRQQGAEMRPTFDQSGNWMSFTMSVEGYVT